MGLIAELKRRNVIRVAIAYAVIAWVIAQIAELAFDSFDAPGWVLKSVLVILALGFPLALFFAWAFELTPDGMKKQAEVDSSTSITQNTGRKLDLVIIAVLAIAVGMLLIDKFILQSAPAPGQNIAVVEETTDTSVAVLPFVAMSTGPDDEYFADGLTEEILNSLAQLPELLVTARTSAFSFKGQDLPIPQIANTLGVAHVVEGSVRRSGDQMRITAQLIRAHDGFHLWSDTYDRSSADSFGVQGEIAEKIAAALGVVLDEEQQQWMQESGMRDPEAFVAFQKGLEIYRHAHEFFGQEQVDELALANIQFEKALELEAEAEWIYFNHADYYVHAAAIADAPADETERAASDALIETAKSDLQNAARYARSEGGRLSSILEYTLIAREWRRLPELFRSAVQLDECIGPSFWGSLGPYAESLAGSIALWESAQACDPLNFYVWANLARVQSLQGDFSAAIATATQGLKLVQHRQIADELIDAHVGAGDFDAAHAANERLTEDPVLRIAYRLRIEAARGNAETVSELRRNMADENGEEDLDMITLALLGERERANRLAAEIDARPLGFVTLLGRIPGCKCGAPFDLEVTPNFARLVEEADLVWPPRRPIDWPLKDW